MSKKVGDMASPVPLPPAEKRTYRVIVCFSEVELLKLETALATPGLARLIMVGAPNERKRSKVISEFLRSTALGKNVPRPVPAINADALWQLKKIGTNLNQTVAMFNADTDLREDPEFISLAKAQIGQLCDALVGIGDADSDR